MTERGRKDTLLSPFARYDNGGRCYATLGMTKRVVAYASLGMTKRVVAYATLGMTGGGVNARSVGMAKGGCLLV